MCFLIPPVNAVHFSCWAFSKQTLVHSGPWAVRQQPQRPDWSVSPRSILHHFILELLEDSFPLHSVRFLSNSLSTYGLVALFLGCMESREQEKMKFTFILPWLSSICCRWSYTNVVPLERAFFCKDRRVNYEMCWIITLGISQIIWCST